MTTLDISRLVRVAAIGLYCCLASCSQQPSAKAPAPPAASASQKEAQELIFSAAASTKDVIEALASQFANQSPAKIQINPGSSSALAAQIVEGAPLDLFLSANELWANNVSEAGLSLSSHKLLTNRLVLVVPRGNLAGVAAPPDLLSDKVRHLALAGEKVPAGQYADQALTKLDLLEKLTASEKIVRGQDVRNTLSFVERGEAEAGIVYATDVRGAPEVEVVHEFDPSLHEEIVYVLVVLRHGEGNPAVKSFAEFLQSPAADRVYEKFGFQRWRETPADRESAP